MSNTRTHEPNGQSDLAKEKLRKAFIFPWSYFLVSFLTSLKLFEVSWSRACVSHVTVCQSMITHLLLYVKGSTIYFFLFTILRNQYYTALANSLRFFLNSAQSTIFPLDYTHVSKSEKPSRLKHPIKAGVYVNRSEIWSMELLGLKWLETLPDSWPP